ncbi:MAG: DNA adenine methylase [Endomicrobium sp.]|nr:DNA adenine methylase [Endomicrobium sp.]
MIWQQYTIFNYNTSYCPHFLGLPSGVYLQKERYEKMVEKAEDFDVKNIEVKCNSFEYTTEQHKNDFLYLDPLYYLEDDSRTFIDMYQHRNFSIHHNGFKHKLSSELLRQHEGGFILSYNDCTVLLEKCTKDLKC